ncbi:hypothetical protein CY34DRAFT_267929 [Suillus luteus UH-Slu-Lm8-n1]|uniref:DNA-directed RNA polymerase III subunit RPC3 winged-helix domain-containing protein n=1 Tax=Suillus luteus UH-Slu-Lm8-n1 TaxID=930992 RepID=A0A0D0B1X5_9AGAM|nr:hypothetical protein CY34DRAFT_267929 [Suillus luteus UH-Slu-Lm8-n1]
MDEKQVAMMPNNVVRPLYAALLSDFLISTQEVPRSADRIFTRTFHLWRLVFLICRASPRLPLQLDSLF